MVAVNHKVQFALVTGNVCTLNTTTSSPEKQCHHDHRSTSIDSVISVQ